MICKLIDYANITMGQSPASEFYNSSGLGTPFLQGNRTFGRKYPSFDTWTTSASKMARKGDVIMSVRAPVGELNIAPDDFCLGRGVCSIRSNDPNQEFLFYLLKYSISRLLSKQTGTVFGSVNRNDIGNLVIDLPSFERRTKIGRILSAIDLKIQINERINGCLTAKLSTMLKSFVNSLSDNPVVKLKQILTLKKDTSQSGQDPELPYLPIDSIPMNSLALSEIRPNSEALSSLLRFQKDDILVGAMRVYFHRVVLAPMDGLTRTTCFVLRPIEPEFLAYCLLTCNTDSAIDFAQQSSKGSTMPYAIWDGGLGEYEIPLPTKRQAEDFNRMAMPLIRMIQSSFFENKDLTILRDSLLPKFMSGEIDVDNIEV